jgi:predicted nucleic acid-binding protein
VSNCEETLFPTTIYTRDRDFRRFEGIRVEDPFV